jgi:hypothetical protein
VAVVEQAPGFAATAGTVNGGGGGGGGGGSRAQALMAAQAVQV